MRTAAGQIANAPIRHARFRRLHAGQCRGNRPGSPTGPTSADSNQRADRLRHQDRQEIPSCHLPLAFQEQDPPIAEGREGEGFHGVQHLQASAVGSNPKTIPLPFSGLPRLQTRNGAGRYLGYR